MQTGLLQTELGVLTLIFVTILVLGITFGIMNVNALKKLRQENQLMEKNSKSTSLYNSGTTKQAAELFEKKNYYENSVANFSGKKKGKTMHDSLAITATFNITIKQLDSLNGSPDIVSYISKLEDPTAPNDGAAINPLFYMGLYGCNNPSSMNSPNDILGSHFILKEHVLTNNSDALSTTFTTYGYNLIQGDGTKDTDVYKIDAYVDLNPYSGSENPYPHFNYIGLYLLNRELEQPTGSYKLKDEDITPEVRLHYFED